LAFGETTWGGRRKVVRKVPPVLATNGIQEATTEGEIGGTEWLFALGYNKLSFGCAIIRWLVK